LHTGDGARLARNALVLCIIDRVTRRPENCSSMVNQAMVDCKNADGMIIDVRGNGGGLGEIDIAMMG
jgi:hypothetical protein